VRPTGRESGFWRRGAGCGGAGGGARCGTGDSACRKLIGRSLAWGG